MKPGLRRPDRRSRHATAPRMAGRSPARTGRPRHFGSLDQRVRRRARRAAALALAAVELAGLVALLVVPALQVHRVDVTGNHRLSGGQVVAAAGLQHPGPILLLDTRAVARRLGGATWVRSASVSASLPDRVSVRVEEWQPVAVYRAGSGRSWYLSDQAVALGPADGSGGAELLGVYGPAQPEPRPGRRALDRGLLTALVNIQRALPGLIGQDVQSFDLDSCGNLTLSTRRGWKVQFGRVLTPEEFASLTDKVGALKALAASGDVDFASADLQYVNVMNPHEVAVKEKDRPVRSGRASPSPRPSASNSPTPQGTAASCR